LGFVFADSLQGGGDGRNSDASENRPWLLHTAKRKTMAGPATRAADPNRLLEEVASEANLARALLNVVRNKGAPGIDGQTVEEAEAQAPRLLADLRRDLLAGRFRPGDIRRVWLPKPGGGERGLGIPNVSTRVVQQAVLQVLEPIYEPTFHPSSHGFRPNRGVAVSTKFGPAVLMNCGPPAGADRPAWAEAQAGRSAARFWCPPHGLAGLRCAVVRRNR